VLVLACMLALVAVIDLWLRGRRLDINSPRRLAIGAINALHLAHGERALLRQVVLRSGIEHPVTVLLSPAAFRKAVSHSGVSDGAGLEARLFNGQSSENTPASDRGASDRRSPLQALPDRNADRTLNQQ